jgi:hypothetical protein
MPTATTAVPPLGTEAKAAGDEQQPKRPKRGDFDAGGQVRLPSGPDEMGKFAAFNWVALDLKGRYFLLDSVTVNANVPLALKKPDTLMTGEDPAMFGGFAAKLEAKLPKTELGIAVTFAYMHEGAMLLSEKDFPLFTGDFQPGFVLGPIAKLRLGSLLDFSLMPSWVRQSGATESLEAVQIPMSAIIKLGSLLKASADLGIFTGDDYSLRARNGGRVTAGGSLTVKLGPILAHAGAGVASLFTGGMYPTIRDSVYLDLNVKYVK